MPRTASHATTSLEVSAVKTHLGSVMWEVRQSRSGARDAVFIELKPEMARFGAPDGDGADEDAGSEGADHDDD